MLGVRIRISLTPTPLLTPSGVGAVADGLWGRCPGQKHHPGLAHALEALNTLEGMTTPQLNTCSQHTVGTSACWHRAEGGGHPVNKRSVISKHVYDNFEAFV